MVKRLGDQVDQNIMVTMNAVDIDQEARALQRDPNVIWGWVGGFGIGILFCAGLLFFPRGVGYFLAALAFLVPAILFTTAYRRSMARAKLNRSSKVPAYLCLLVAISSIGGVLFFVMLGMAAG